MHTHTHAQKALYCVRIPSVAASLVCVCVCFCVCDVSLRHHCNMHTASSHTDSECVKGLKFCCIVYVCVCVRVCMRALCPRSFHGDLRSSNVCNWLHLAFYHGDCVCVCVCVCIGG